MLSLFLVLEGCTVESDVIIGRFEGCLRDVEPEDLGDHVQIVDDRTWISLHFFHDDLGEFQGELTMDGEVELYGYPIRDGGHHPFPLLKVRVRDTELKGKIDVPEVLINLGIEGEFSDDRSLLGLDAGILGLMVLDRVEDDVTGRDRKDGPADNCAPRR